ncbi:hypothetical protein BC939DRAFT_460358 [Gamsiella multidivaricata]|uniref:uncharacterized protein n=1 Tax=Gamsiella multidivaricata TaxID=101098 RepID=UPI00221FD420|nr:uncharacterized protein BC939DRAFT_460358 [Gamsiella multidivaricata]KAG0346394.1 hypothetical protein BGZ54_005228 [Gamsiella multidivaricata]KAI7819301.1 hypothetical protein BC939DRAFT_460358 [Gamsiella multidivaricata]
MARILTTLLALSSLVLSTISAQVTSAYLPSKAVAPVMNCTIATPITVLRTGQPYLVQFSGCRGNGRRDTIRLRYGNPTNLFIERVPACVNVDFATGHCVFTPTRPGVGFVFSAIDGSGVPTYSGPFTVVAASTPSSAAVTTAPATGAVPVAQRLTSPTSAPIRSGPALMSTSATTLEAETVTAPRGTQPMGTTYKTVKPQPGKKRMVYDFVV